MTLAALTLLAALSAPARPATIGQLLLAEDRREAGSNALREALAAPEPGLRGRAARALGRIQDPAALDPLLAALVDPDAGVRAEVLFALGQLRMEDEAAPPPRLTQRLLGALAAPEPALRAAAAEALGKSGGEGAEERLAGLLRDADAGARRQAAAALFRLRFLKRIPEYATATVSALAASLDDADSETAWRAAYAFSRWPEPRAASALAESLGRPSPHAAPWLDLFAARSLVQLGKEAPAEAGLQALGHGYAGVRVEGLRLLAAAGAADRIPEGMVEDADSHVRTALAAALAEAPGREGLLRRLAADPSPMVRASAVSSLTRLSGEGFREGLELSLGDPHPWVRSRAVLAAGGLPGGLAQVEKALADPDLDVRSAAVEAVGKRTAPAAGELLGRILADASAPLELRGAAVEAVATRKSTGLARGLMACYSNSLGREFVEVREGVVDAAAALARPEDKELAAFRESLLEDPAPSVRAKAAKSLGRPVPPSPPGEVSPFLGRPDPLEGLVWLETDKGEVTLELDYLGAPLTARSVALHARAGGYDGTPWHRVVSNFVVQGGDPRGTGWGDAGYSLRDEVHPGSFERGSVGMPKAGKDTGGCQLFVTHLPTPHLDGRYTLLGRVIDGMEVVDRLEPGDKIRRAGLRRAR